MASKRMHNNDIGKFILFNGGVAGYNNLGIVIGWIHENAVTFGSVLWLQRNSIMTQSKRFIDTHTIT